MAKEERKLGRVIGMIYETTDYDMFNRLDGNRDVDERRVKDCEKSIDVHGQLRLVEVNELMEIIDGQARVAALQRLGMPIQYYIKQGAGLTECIEENNTGRKWPTESYIKSFIQKADTPKQVKKDYQLLLECLTKYKKSGLTENIIIKICAKDWGGGSVIKATQKGLFRFKRPPEIATKLLDYLADFSMILKRCGRKELVVPVLCDIYEDETINNEIFLARCIRNMNQFHGVASTEEARIMFQYAYNCGLKKNKIQLVQRTNVSKAA